MTSAALFKKKPVVVMAIRFTGQNVFEVQEFVGKIRDTKEELQGFKGEASGKWSDPEIVASVWNDLHATWVGVKEGQWIIKDVKGEFYPCDHDVFQDTYSVLMEDSAENTIVYHHDDETMMKVYRSLEMVGLGRQQILDAVTHMQNAGIYFREIRRD